MSNFNPFDDETAVAPPELQEAMKKRGSAHWVSRETFGKQQADSPSHTPLVQNEPAIALHPNQAPLRLDDQVGLDPPSTKRMIPLGKPGREDDLDDEFTVEESQALENKELVKIAERIQLASTPTSDPLRGFLVVTKGSDKGRRVGLPEGRTTIGRGTDNDIVLTDIAVSRKHIVVERRERIYYICDIGSGNGTIVNGRKREGEILIVNGDSFSIGNTDILFEGPEAQQRTGNLSTNTWDQPKGKGANGPEQLPDDEAQRTVSGRGLQPSHAMEVAYEEPTNVVPSVQISPDLLQPANIKAPITLEDSSKHNAQEAAIDAIASIDGTPEPEILSMHSMLPDSASVHVDSEVEVYSSSPPSLPPKKLAAMTMKGRPMPALPTANLQSANPPYRGAPAPLLTGAPSSGDVPGGQWPQAGLQAQAPLGQAPSGQLAPKQLPIGQMPAGQMPAGQMPPMLNSGAMGMPLMQQGSGPMQIGLRAPTSMPPMQQISGPTQAVPRIPMNMPPGARPDLLRDRYAHKPKAKNGKALIALVCLVLVFVVGGIVVALNGQATSVDTVAEKTADTVVEKTADTVVEKTADTVAEKTADTVVEKTAAAEESKNSTGVPQNTENVKGQEEEGIASLIAKNTVLPVSTWGNDETFLSDIPTTITPETTPPPDIVPTPTIKKAKPTIAKGKPRIQPRRPNQPPPEKKSGTSAIKASARALYKRQRFDDAADKLEDAADNFDDDDSDKLLAIADRYRQVGNLLNKVSNGNPTSGLISLRKALKKDKSAGGALSKLIHARIGEIAPKAAFAYMSKKKYTKAKSAADDAKREGQGSSVERVFSSLERKAANNVKKAKRAMRDDDDDEAARLLKEAIKIAPKNSDSSDDARDMLRKL